jgi:hypothetical protein
VKKLSLLPKKIKILTKIYKNGAKKRKKRKSRKR